MMKKVLLVLLLCLVASPAFAFDLGGYTGPVSFHVTVYSYGTVYSPNSLPFNLGGLGTGSVNTYGLLSVDTIDGINPNTLVWESVWTSSASESIEGMFGGLTDNVGYLNPDGKFVFNEIGGKVRLYLDSSRDLSIVNNPQVPGAGLAWWPTDIYNATDGTPFLTADFVPGILVGDNVTTYTETINSLSKPFTGSGSGYLALNNEGGLYNSMFDSNGYLDGSADLVMSVDLLGNATNPNWTRGRDPIEGATIPEPASMILMGLGLLGAVRRRRKA